MLSTAGPFELFGDRLVEACVEAHTHYVDITGEVVWVRSLIDRFHKRAERDSTKIVPFCGFDSVPADLGVLFLRQHLGEELAEAKAYFQAKGGRPNGGTIASAHHTYSSGADKAGRDPFLLCPGFQRALFPLEVDPSRASFDSDVNAWVAPFPMSILDSRVVRRSSLLAGVDFPYQEFAIFTGVLAPVWARAAAAGTGLFFAVLRSPATRNLARRMMGAGGGPSEDAMNGGYFTCRVWGRTRAGQTGEVLLRCAGDPANRVTVLCVCESALALVCNPGELPARAGVLTPSTGIAMRLSRACETVSSPFRYCAEFGEIGYGAELRRAGSTVRKNPCDYPVSRATTLGRSINRADSSGICHAGVPPCKSRTGNRRGERKSDRRGRVGSTSRRAVKGIRAAVLGDAESRKPENMALRR